MTIVPTENDVLFGRGGAINFHPGNNKFRSMVGAQRRKFAEEKVRKKKRAIATNIMDAIHNAQPPGRFLMEAPKSQSKEHNGNRGIGNNLRGSFDREASKNGIHPVILDKVWVCVEHDKAIAKVMHRLREKGNEGSVLQTPAANSVQGGANDGDGSRSSDASTSAVGSLKSPPMNEDLLQLSGGEGRSNDRPLPSGSIETSSGTHRTSAAVLEKISPRPMNNFSSLVGVGGPNHHPLPPESIGISGGGEQSQSIEAFADAAIPLNFTREPMNDFSSQIGTERPNHHSLQTQMWGTLMEPQDENEKKMMGELVETFLRDFSAQNDGGGAQGPLEFSLQRWMEISKPTPDQQGGNVLEYIRSALPIALKLTECLIIEEQGYQPNERNNSIPPSNIATANVFLLSTGSGVSHSIQHVRITSRGVGGDYLQVTSRLFALGIVLYELFSADRLRQEDMPAFFSVTSNSLTLNAIGLNSESGTDDHHRRPSKKSQRQLSSSTEGNAISQCTARLKSKGAPSSICALVGNLLDCSNGEFSSDDCYKSFEDLQLDLKLMMDDPSRFLDDIPANPMHPLSMLGDKIYGREEEINVIKQSFLLRSEGRCCGVITKGGAGVGKSKLATYVRDLTIESNGYFSMAKFDQNEDVMPLSTIGTLFNSLCNLFVQDSTPAELQLVEEILDSALSNQADLLAGVVPTLKKLMPSAFMYDISSSCVDSAASMRYLFGKLLLTLASIWGQISVCIDDLQWADPASLLLISYLMSSTAGCSSIFFTFSYRDDEVGDNEPFNAWLYTISSFPMKVITLKGISPESVTSILSDSLHLSPRLTRPLASVLHHKTRGNPLFLRQLIESLKEQGLIFIDWSHTRWSWDLNKIMNTELHSDVLALLVSEMQGLPTDLQFGLKVASCWGSCVKYSIVDILSEELKVDLAAILKKVCNRGFMTNISDDALFRFSHDKIEQAAHDLMSEQQRRKYHMRFGLALFSNILNSYPNAGVGDDELFFAAVNQTNNGGPSAVTKTGQKSIVAGLNLKAGRRAIELSDYRAAFKLFKHGISFLEDGHWTACYKLSLDLFNAAAEAACVINNGDAVKIYSDQVVAHAKFFDDKLNCLYCTTQVLRNSEKIADCCDSAVDLLSRIGEEPLRPLGDAKLNIDIQHMNIVLLNMSDESILNMGKATSDKNRIILKLYAMCLSTFQFINPSLKAAVSVQLVSHTLKTGLSAMSPIAFAAYGELLAGIGKIPEACRLGRLALKLLQKRDLATQSSHAIFLVHQTVLWSSDPLQSIVDAHLRGQKAGQQSGDEVLSNLNWHLSIVVSHVAGYELNNVAKESTAYIREVQGLENQLFAGFMIFSVLLHSTVVALKEGLHLLELDHIENIPTERVVLAKAPPNPMIELQTKIYRLSRAFLFRQFDEVSVNADISDNIAKYKHQLNPLYLQGVLFEGLASFYLARDRPNERLKWITKGDSALARIRGLSEHSSWNWKNKTLLLEAERMYTLRDDGAALFYEKAIQSANEQKFIHEEGIASELAGIFYCEKGLHQKSSQLLLHSARSYKKWGALAVARRVEGFIEKQYGLDVLQMLGDDDALECIFETSESMSNKRQVNG